MLTLLKSYLDHFEALDGEDNRDSVAVETGPPPSAPITPPVYCISQNLLDHMSCRLPECQPNCSSYDNFFEQFRVFRSQDDVTVLVCDKSYQSEVNGTLVFDDWGERDDDPDGVWRVRDTVKIYEHLFSDQTEHPLIVRYLGPTVSGYKLERLHPGPMPDISPLPSPKDNDAVLVYQYMTDNDSPICEKEKDVQDEEILAKEEAVVQDRSAEWPKIEARYWGPVLLKA